MNNLFCYLEQLLMDIIWNSENRDEKNKREDLKAINKFIWIQNDLLTMHYEFKWNKDNTCQKRNLASIMAEHIDKTRLNTDLHYRFEYLSKFLNFTKDDIISLNTLAAIIFPRIPFTIETVYKKLYTYDIIQQYFILRNDDFESFSSDEETNTSVISGQTDYRKDMLSMYLKRIFIQTEWNDRFLQFLSHIGEIYTESDHSIPTNVDYIHINALLGYLEHLLIEIIWNIEHFDLRKKRLAVGAINKFFWIQNDFFTMHFGISIKQDPISNIPSKKQGKWFCK